MYYEESDWQYRAHLQGLRTIYEPKCVAMHLGRATAGEQGLKLIQKNQKTFKKKYQGKNIEKFNENL
jgi:GT2 family glycosyltransferase